MKSSKLLWPFVFSLFFVFVIIITIGLPAPSIAQAGPLAGFTPSPPTPTPNNNNDDNPSLPLDSSKEQIPPDYVLVEVDRCDLQCVADLANANERSNFQFLASAGVADAPQPLFVPSSPAQSLPELLLPVRLVHEGSAFIVEGELSNSKVTRFVVPYPGHWQVWLTGEPRFVTAQTVDMTGSNLASLQAQLARNPISLGLIEADTTEPQLVKCPLVCVLDEPPPDEVPPDLPQTGDDKSYDLSLVKFLLVNGLNIALIGLTLWIVTYYRCREPHL